MDLISTYTPRKRVHFIGIGGVGMSALAHILLGRGFQVSGSDAHESSTTRRLGAAGAGIFFGHHADHVGDVDLIVYSSCIRPDNLELRAGRERGIATLKRGQLLAHLMQPYTTIAVAGAHGKTTTTSLLAYMFRLAGREPTFAIGADVAVLGGNASQGQGQFFIAESDESDGSFLYLKPSAAIVTNIDREHLDYYPDFDHIVAAYTQFINQVDPAGAVVCCGDDPAVAQACRGYRGLVRTYGFGTDNTVRGVDLSCTGSGSHFSVVSEGKPAGRYELRVPGKHNVANALAAVTMARHFGIDERYIVQALAQFSGAQRRFQVRADGRIMIVEDYAHHPTEIMATLSTAKLCGRPRIIGVFQPHRYTRTKALYEEFGRCFQDADQVIVTDIYAASETPIEGISGQTVVEQIRRNGHAHVCWQPRDGVRAYVQSELRAGDMVVILGAGDIGALAEELRLLTEQEAICGRP